MKIVIVGQLSHERRPPTGSRPQVGHPPDGTDPLLLNQPEDDLDNKLIKQPAVETLKNIETRPQTSTSTICSTWWYVSDNRSDAYSSLISSG
ncbi:MULTISPECIES: hypothetical protein [unclassified Kribbella]|uniref:hypothetical protein n=1 Tax=unclassified Kribbella TaxID=2644121 RepID=UPI00301B5F52